MRKWQDDPFTRKARRENFEARSVYKLDEIDKREKVLTGANLILDLGAAPGSWTQYCLKQRPSAKVVAIDLSPVNVSDPRLHFIQSDIEAVDLSPFFQERKADVVLSDMAPKTSGIHDRDVALSFELAQMALNSAYKWLKPGGNFVVKLFMGGSFEEFNREVKKAFTSVKLLRPESTRKHSREIFFIGKGFRGVSGSLND